MFTEGVEKDEICVLEGMYLDECKSEHLSASGG